VSFAHRGWRERAKTRSAQSVKRLLDLPPETAHVVGDDGEQDKPVAQIEAGMSVRVRPGERIPVDGEVTDGKPAMAEALITGESLPVEKPPAIASWAALSTATAPYSSGSPRWATPVFCTR
jgi:P-type E1-E2 ATPase